MADISNQIANGLNEKKSQIVDSFKAQQLEAKRQLAAKKKELQQKAEEAKKKAEEAKKKAQDLKAKLKGYKVPSLPKVPKFKMKDIQPPAVERKILEASALASAGIVKAKNIQSTIKNLKNKADGIRAQIEVKLKSAKEKYAKAAKSVASLDAEEMITSATNIQNYDVVSAGSNIASVYKVLFKGTGKKVNITGASEITYTPNYPQIGVDTGFTEIIVTNGGVSSGGSTGGSGGSSSGGGGGGVVGSGGGPTNTGGGAEGGYQIEVTATDGTSYDEVYGVYKSMVKNPFTGNPSYKLAWPSNSIIYGDRVGKVTINVTTQLWEYEPESKTRGKLLLEVTNDSVDQGSTWWNNHRADFLIPGGNYLVVIKNNSYTGNRDLAFILAQGWYQRPNEPMQYITRNRIYPGDQIEFSFNTAKILPAANSSNNLIKVNNTNILE